jgi:hypothetical protein
MKTPLEGFSAAATVSPSASAVRLDGALRMHLVNRTLHLSAAFGCGESARKAGRGVTVLEEEATTPT